MTLQRKVDPIPPGRYWMNVIGRDNIQDFLAWVQDMGPSVNVETTSLDDTATPVEEFLAGGQNPSRLFVIFTVPEGRAPFLDSRTFGFPSHAPSGIQDESDTVQRPDVESGTERLIGLLKTIVTLAGIGLGVGIAVRLARK